MTYRDRFCEAMRKRGYEVENLGLMTFLRCEAREGGIYTAVHFFCEDGSLDRESTPQWWIS
jgi:hypothetical protein